MARRGCARHARTHALTQTEVKGSPPVLSVLVRSVFLCVSLFLPFVNLGIERVLPLLSMKEKKNYHIFTFLCFFQRLAIAVMSVSGLCVSSECYIIKRECPDL